MEKIEKLIAGLEKAEMKVDKTNATIERHFKQLNKKVSELEKGGLKISIGDINFQVKGYAAFKDEIDHIEVQKWDEKGTGIPLYWELCDVCSKMEDIYRSYIKLEDAERIANNWKVKVVSEKTKINFAESAPKVIIDFVNKWGEMAFEWLMQNDENAEEKRTRSLIENEKRIKVILLTTRVTNIVGTITDASQLDISDKGDLVGVIEGDRGRAMVETITAGGWNIQRYHYRTIVNKI